MQPDALPASSRYLLNKSLAPCLARAGVGLARRECPGGAVVAHVGDVVLALLQRHGRGASWFAHERRVPGRIHYMETLNARFCEEFMQRMRDPASIHGMLPLYTEAKALLLWEAHQRSHAARARGLPVLTLMYALFTDEYAQYSFTDANQVRGVYVAVLNCRHLHYHPVTLLHSGNAEHKFTAFALKHLLPDMYELFRGMETDVEGMGRCLVQVSTCGVFPREQHSVLRPPFANRLTSPPDRREC